MPENPNAGHRSRMMARVEKDGMSFVNLHEHEVLEMFLFLLIPRVNTNHTAHQLIERFGSLNGVFAAPAEEIAEIRGISKKTAAAIKLFGAVFEGTAETRLIEEEQEEKPN